MTDAEMLLSLSALVDTLWSIFAIYVSIVFAFLVAGYLVAARLTPRIVAMVVTVYTLVAIWAFAGLRLSAFAATSMSLEIRRAVLEGSSTLGWHPTATAASPAMFSAIPYLVLAIALIAYVASIVFFFHQRKLGMNEELQLSR